MSLASRALLYNNNLVRLNYCTPTVLLSVLYTDRTCAILKVLLFIYPSVVTAAEIVIHGPLQSWLSLYIAPFMLLFAAFAALPNSPPGGHWIRDDQCGFDYILKEQQSAPPRQRWHFENAVDLRFVRVGRLISRC